MARVYVSKNVRSILIIGVIVVSLIISIGRSGILESPSKGEVPPAFSEKADEIFQSYNYAMKLELKFVAPNVSEIKNKLNQIVQDSETTILYSLSEGNAATNIIELPIESYNTAIAPIRELPGLVSDQLLRSNIELPIEDIQRRIKDEEALKQKILNDISRSASPYELDALKTRLSQQNSLIDSLKSVVAERERGGKYLLAKIDIIKNAPPTPVSGKVKSLLLNFIGSIIVLTLILVICYVIILGFIKLFQVLGIRTAHGSSGYRSYGYGDYGYGERRIKRKYIKKPPSESESKDAESKEDSKK